MTTMDQANRRFRAAMLLLGVSLVALAAAALRASRITDPVGSAHTRAVLAPPNVALQPHASLASVLVAVRSDPLHPLRRAPATRYEFDDDPSTASVPEQGTVNTGLKLLGTAVSSANGGGFAMCQLGEDAPAIVRLGQSIGPYELRRVEPGRAVFRERGGENLVLTVDAEGALP